MTLDSALAECQNGIGAKRKHVTEGRADWSHGKSQIAEALILSLVFPTRVAEDIRGVGKSCGGHGGMSTGRRFKIVLLRPILLIHADGERHRLVKTIDVHTAPDLTMQTSHFTV